MSRETMLILLGVLVALTPFVGLPLSWRAVIIPILGALVVLIGITLRAHKLQRVAEPKDPAESVPTA